MISVAEIPEEALPALLLGRLGSRGPRRNAEALTRVGRKLAGHGWRYSSQVTNNIRKGWNSTDQIRPCMFGLILVPRL